MAAYRESWEKNLQSVLTETEVNISNLKTNMTPKFESTPFIRRQMNYGVDEGFPSHYSPMASHSLQRARQFSEFKRPNIEVNEKASMIVSFSKRLENIELITSSLNNSVTALKYDNEVKNEEIKRLKGEIKHLTKRVHEKGVDLETEKKLHKWQREVRSELETIQSLMKTKSKSNEYSGLSDITLISLSKDISDSKRLLMEETDSLRRECDNMKIRILKLENETAVVIGESKDLGMRQMRLEKDVASVNEAHRSYSRNFSKLDREYMSVKTQIEEIRREIDNIQYKIEKREYKLKGSRSKGKSSSKWKDSPQWHEHEENYGTLIEKGDLKLANATKNDSFENSSNISLLSSELDDLSLNTSLNLSDELIP